MMYGAMTLIPAKGSISITKKNTQIVRHYPGTNVSDFFSLGKESTTITCQLIALTQEDAISIEAMLHSSVERELHFDNYYYKKVIAGNTFSPNKVDGHWLIDAEFIALDPIPYDATSGEALY